MNTVVLEVRSLADTLAEAFLAMKTGQGDARRVGRGVKAANGHVTALLDAGVLRRAPGGGVEFPYDSIKVEFMLQTS